ncbi:dapper homolog 3-like [Anguilla rostrata]|uniref:dapper homolog 3-like n=1 Tax=Anguilla rostrata TaxID=7938 RepID=UPI0030D2DB94
MYRALSFPMTAERSRNKERLEASLAGLRELELLKQRQEFLVLRALSLGDATPGHASWGDLQPPRSAPPALNRAQDDLTLRRQLNSLQCASWGLMAELEQQVGELRVEAEPVCDEPPGDKGDSRPSSGFYEPSEVQSSAGLSDSSVFGELSPGPVRAVRAAYAGERPKSVGDVFVANRDGLLETGPLSLVPRSFSAPYPSLEGIEEGLGEEEAWVWDPSGPSGLEDEPTAEDYQQARRVHSYILGLIQRRALPQRPCKPRTSLGPDFRAVARQSSLCRKEPELRPAAPEAPPVWACRGPEQEEPYGGPEEPLPLLYARPRPACLAGIRSASLDFPCGVRDPAAEEGDSPRFHGYPPPEDRLVNAQYIPAQPCRAPARGPAHRAPPPPPPKPGRASCSPEGPPQRARPAPKKCRLSEERAPGPRKPSRKACRSQSENSLVGGQRGGAAERKYNTVERDGGRGGQPRTRRPPPVGAGCRRWRSTLELSQDEAELPGDQAPRRAARKPRLPPPYPYGHAHGPALPPHPRHLAEYLERGPPCRPEEGYALPPPGGESESSLSEADSPGSTSLSSDSEESGGGLVWPQQLPPQLAPPSVSPPTPPGAAPPKAFVKIKASHALKKKILRFRTGSLKVMTTV